MTKEKRERGEVSRRDFLIGAGSVVVGGAIGAGITYPLVAGKEVEKTVEITKTVTAPATTVTTTVAADTVTTTIPGTTVTTTVAADTVTTTIPGTTVTTTVGDGVIEPAFEPEETHYAKLMFH